MDYEVSSSERVRNLNRELDYELKDLQNEIEEGNLLGSNGAPESFSSFHIPNDIKYFINQRKCTIAKYLQVREAKSLQSHSDLMDDEVKSCLKSDYTQNSIPLLLHKFYLKRVKELLLLRHLHMIRWVRFCQHTKVIEDLFPEYSKRMNEIALEFQDAVERSRRLSRIYEANIVNSPIPLAVIKNEDLVIYTRWLVCHFHATKKIHAYLQEIQWIPQTFTNIDFIYEEIKYKGTTDDEEASTFKLKDLTGNSSDTSTSTESNPAEPNLISSDCQFHEPKKNMNMFAPIHTLGKWKRKAAKARERGMLRKYQPIISTSLEDFEVLLNYLLSNYEIDMSCSQLKGASDEIDMYNVVVHKFKEVHFRQEQDRTFPVYGCTEISEQRDGKVVYKRESNWLPFIQIKPDIDGVQLESWMKYKHQNHKDELLMAQSKLLYVESAEKIISLFKEYTRQRSDQCKIEPTNVTTYQKGQRSQSIWKKLFSISDVGQTSSRHDALEIDSKIQSDMDMAAAGVNVNIPKSNLDVKDIGNNPSFSNGALLSLKLLKHLKIKDNRQSCLCILNYFRSIERTLTIDNSSLTIEDNDAMVPPPPSRQMPQDSDGNGIGSHQFLHNTPVDYEIQVNMQYTEVKNHDNFYIFRSNNVYVQDEGGQFIFYDSAMKDFSKLEAELLLVGSHSIKKGSEETAKKGTKKAFSTEFDLDAIGSSRVDRFGVLMDLWGNESLYLEAKRNLVDCFFETYHHITNAEERRKIAQIIISLIYKRPRFDFSAEYFVTSYQAEIKLLNIYFELIKAIIDEQIDDQRAFVEKLHKEEIKPYGIPFKVIPGQSIAVNNSQPTLKNIFMLEFHPSLAMISYILPALQNAFREVLHAHPALTIMEHIKVETFLLENVQEKWVLKKSFSDTYTDKVKKELLADVFIEDPMAISEICEVMNPVSNIGARTITKDEVGKMIGSFASLLDVITCRNRLILAMNESTILADIYQKNATNLGYKRCHAFLRPISFDKADLSIKPVRTSRVLSDDDKVDRYLPSQYCLAMSELDEKDMFLPTFRTRDGVIKNLEKSGLEKLQLALLTQTCDKNLFVALLHQLNGCRNLLRTSCVKNTRLLAVSDAVKKSMLSKLQDKLKKAFISIQNEKKFYRDSMLNDYAKMAEQKAMGVQKPTQEMKKDVIHTYCMRLHEGLRQHSLRAQIIAYTHSMLQLLNCFPEARDSHFIFGEESDCMKHPPDELDPISTSLKQRPRRFLSSDGDKILNLWFVPHFSEILSMYQSLEVERCTAILKIVLLLMSALHDICHYLCAHARSGNSSVKKGKIEKIEFSNDTADWGGAEGIGSELLEIQKQINRLKDPYNPEKVAEFLIHKRDVMFLQYDITLNHSVPNAFLASGNSTAYKSITASSNFQKLGNLYRYSIKSFNLDIPDPLFPGNSKAQELFPWRCFVAKYGYVTGCYDQFYDISFNMQLSLMDLNDIDKRSVNGEILGVSLLLEDVLNSGAPYIPQAEQKPLSGLKKLVTTVKKAIPASSAQKGVGTNIFSVATTLREIKSKNDSIRNCPVEAMKFLRRFLITWSQLEHMKRIWGCRRIQVMRINTTTIYKDFLHYFNKEVLHQVCKRFLTKRDVESLDNEVHDGEVNEQMMSVACNLSVYELKIYLLQQLLENIELTMIQDSIRKVARESTQVVAERSRGDHVLPIDLWKMNTHLKENATIERPHLVEKLIDDLKISNEGDTITFDRKHLNDCLMKLANACSVREKTCYLNYATFYENLLRHHNQLLYFKEQEIKHLNATIESSQWSTSVEIDCKLAEKSFNLLIEVTALRTRVSDLIHAIDHQESTIRKSIRKKYNDLALALFDNAFSMVWKFEKFQLTLYDDVIHQLTEARRDATDKIKNVQVKHGSKTDKSDAYSPRLVFAEQMRRLEWENKQYVSNLAKLKVINQWNSIKEKSRYEKNLRDGEENLGKLKYENELQSVIYAEKEILMKEEKEEMCKLLVHLEHECDSLRKKMEKEKKLRAEKAYVQLHEQKSFGHIKSAKTANCWEKLVSDLSIKEKELQSLKDTNLDNRRNSARSASEMKRILKQTSQQVQDERKLKLEAYGRVDELQKKIDDLEIHISSLLSNEKLISHNESCFPLVPGGRASPQKLKMARSQNIAKRPKSSIPLSRKSDSRLTCKTPFVKTNKSEMFLSGTNWSGK